MIKPVLRPCRKAGFKWHVAKKSLIQLSDEDWPLANSHRVFQTQGCTTEFKYTTNMSEKCCVFTLTKTARHLVYKCHLLYVTFIFGTLHASSSSKPPFTLCYCREPWDSMESLPSVNPFPSVLGNGCVCAKGYYNTVLNMLMCIQKWLWWGSEKTYVIPKVLQTHLFNWVWNHHKDQGWFRVKVLYISQETELN